jgi:hypothetical protein
MTEMKDPVRLSLGGSPAAQDLLRSASSDAPSSVQLDHLAAKLAPIVLAKGAATSSIAAWIIVGIVVVGGATGAFFLTRDREPPAVAIAPSTPITPAPVTPAPTPAAPVVVGEPPATAPSVAPEPPRPSKKRVVAPPVVEETLPPREIDLLDPAHQALRANDAARALALADRHAELYARGAMSEEREAIAIEALHRLGRDARIRFEEFVVRFPRSGYRARLERLVTETKR